MKNSYAENKKLRSLSNRYISEYNAHQETTDLNGHYNSDLLDFIESLLEQETDYQRAESELKTGRRKSGERPEGRTPGERPKPLRLKQQTGIVKSTQEPDIQIPIHLETMPSWKKKLWKKIMMAVHPDRIDAIASNQKDKLIRIQIRELLQENESDAMIVSGARLLNIVPGISKSEQERKLRLAILELKQKIKIIQESASWIWGESFTDTGLRLRLVKIVLANNSVTTIKDDIILEHISRNP